MSSSLGDRRAKMYFWSKLYSDFKKDQFQKNLTKSMPVISMMMVSQFGLAKIKKCIFVLRKSVDLLTLNTNVHHANKIWGFYY